MTLSGLDFILIGLAAVGAGAVNALAGGGTLITFPMLTAVGLPAVVANVTNTVALCPGYLGGTLAQANDLRDQKQRLWLYLPVGAIGGILGGLLLLYTGERIFRTIVPYLILLASALLAVQEPLRAWILHRAQSASASQEMNSQAEQMKGFVSQLMALVGGRNGNGAVSMEEPRHIGAGHVPKSMIHHQPGAGNGKGFTVPARKTKGVGVPSPRAKGVRPEQVIPLEEGDFKEF